MLADVVKEREQQQQREYQEMLEKYNKPVKRDTIIYFSYFHIIGGIETWIYNLAKRYEFSVVYDKAEDNQIKRLKDIGVETIKNVGQEIECNTLLFCISGDGGIKANKKLLFIHGIYNSKDEIEKMPEYDEIYAVSQVAANRFYNVFGIIPKVLYNHIDIEEKEKPLIIGIFSRLSKEKGGYRVKYLADKLIENNKPFLMLIFTDLPFEYDDKRVLFMKPTLDSMGWMKICDYICQLSDTEAGSLTIQEALKMEKPLIITKLPILEEFGINESNAKILEFDMSNLNIDDLWNIPKVKWHEPVSKEWKDIMKKKVFRAMYGFKDMENVIEKNKQSAETIMLLKKSAKPKNVIKETDKKTTKKKVGK